MCLVVCQLAQPVKIEATVECAHRQVPQRRSLGGRQANRAEFGIGSTGDGDSRLTVADEILQDKNVFVIPDILANAGGVTASYFEWVQDRQGYFWKESVVNEQLESILTESFDDVVRYAETHNVHNRIAAYMLAIDRVAFTIKQRGIYA